MLALLIEFLVVVGIIAGIVVFAISFIKKMIKRKLDTSFNEKYIDTPANDERVEKKLSSLDRTKKVLGIISFFMIPAVAVPFIILIAQGSVDGYVFIPMLAVCALITLGGLMLRRFSYRMMGRTLRLLALYVGPVLEEFFGSDVTYDLHGEISRDVVSSAGFFRRIDRVNGTNLVQGYYKGYPIMFSDVSVEEEREYQDPETGKKTKKFVTIFNGYWVVVDFDRELSPVPLNIHEERSKDGIQMEDDSFNEKFSVYCPDQHTAFYILTPHFMQRLVAVDQIAAGRSHFRFEKNRMQIAVDGGTSLFLPGNLDKAKVSEIQESFRGNLRQITGLIDEMMKHEKIFGDTESGCSNIAE